MSVLDALRKGFGYVLMSMGVSSPAKKKPAPKPAAKPGVPPHLTLSIARMDDALPTSCASCYAAAMC